MNDNIDVYKAYEKRLTRDKLVYKFVFGFTLGLLGFSIWYAFVNTQTQRKAPQFLPSQSVEIEGKKKPLPDFIIEKITPDEMEQLKP